MVEGGLTIRQLPSPNWHLGDDVIFGCGVIVDVKPGAELRIGSRSKVMHNSIVAAHEAIRMGDDAVISELTSVRDAEHRNKLGDFLTTSQLQARPVIIGDGAAILRGSVVLAGVNVGAGAVVGANSVVTRDIPPNTIAYGAPARPARQRDDR